jgi:hypothetical protein
MKLKFNANENGNALLMVLMVVVVFTILGVGLLSMNASASKQFDKKEEKVQARHQAEMGVLHYKAEVNEMLVAHNVALKRIGKEEKNVEKLKALLSSQNKAFCSELAKKTTTKSLTNERYTVKLKDKVGVKDTGCEYDENDKIIKLTVNSLGEAGLAGKAEIDADLFMYLPKLDFTMVGKDNGGSGTTPPTPEKPAEVNTIWPCTDNKCEDIISKYTKVTDAVMKMGSLKFEDHLVVNNFRAEGGNGAHLTIAKDFYVENMISVQTHACIAVQGNLTVKNTIESKNKLFIFVYGNAYLPSNINLTSSNNDIYVSGNVYIGGVLQVPKPASVKNVPNNSTSNECKLPGPSNQGSDSTEINIFEWDLGEEIKAIYK